MAKVSKQTTREASEKSDVHRLRIPIFVKLTFLSILLIFIVVATIGFSMLEKQKEQFTEQLIDLGESMVRIITNNAPEKLLADEDLSLFQLIKDITKNEQVRYALITDQKNSIRAHSNIEEVSRQHVPLPSMTFIEDRNNTRVFSFTHDKEQLLYFEKIISYQKVNIGIVRLVITQNKLLQNTRNARNFILLLAVFILFLGILLSLGFSVYFSRPIRNLHQSTEAIAEGNFGHRVNIKRNDELGDLGSAFNRMATDLSERDAIREAFGKYLSPEIRDLILSGRIPLNGEKRIATLLFSDLRDFTPYVESNSSEEIVRSMRAYFTAMEKEITGNSGLVLQYVGDEIEAVFGVPLWYEDHAEKAVMAAIRMKKRLKILNSERAEKGLPPFRHGIGIHTGEVIAGNTGSEDRPSYALIGSTVNLASRIQSLTKEFNCDILVSEDTVKQIGDSFQLKKEQSRMVKGYSRPIVVYQVVG